MVIRMLTQKEKNKFRRYSEMLHIVMRVFLWISTILACTALAGSLTIFLMPHSNFLYTPHGSGRLSLNLEGLFMSFRLEVNPEGTVNIQRILYSSLFMTGLVLAGLSLIFRQLKSILYDVAHDRPFHPQNGSRVTYIGVIVLFASVLVPLGGFIISWEMLSLLEMPNLSAKYYPNGTMCVTGMLLILLGYIFRYGSELQQEVDETV